MVHRSDEVYEFEPGATTLLLFTCETEDDTPFDADGVSLKVSIIVKKVRYDLIGLWEPEHEGFVIDLSVLKDVVTSTNLISGYMYITLDNVWERIATIYLKPITGAEWQPTT